MDKRVSRDITEHQRDAICREPESDLLRSVPGMDLDLTIL